MEIIDPTTYPGWDNLLLSSPNAGIFHTSLWARVLKESYGYQPIYFAEMADAQVKNLIPLMEINSYLTGKRGVSLPFTDYCEFIESGDKGSDNILDSVIDYGKKAKWKYLEVRDGRKIMPGEPAFFYYYGHKLDLTKGAEKIFADFRDSTKRNIKKALKEGITAKIENSKAAVTQYYHLQCKTRKQHGLPPQPESFFKKIYEHIISQGYGFVVLGCHQGRAVSGGIYLQFGKRAMYKYGASDRDYQNLRANNAVMWEAIQWYSRNHFEEFCFGRTEPENEGLLQFKNGWRAEQQEIYYYRYDIAKSKFIQSKSKESPVFRKIFNRLPIPALRLAGSILYKHMG